METSLLALSGGLGRLLRQFVAGRHGRYLGGSAPALVLLLHPLVGLILGADVVHGAGQQAAAQQLLRVGAEDEFLEALGVFAARGGQRARQILRLDILGR
ncbi:hypothetical protein E2C01_074509 [Portunus trituberculatus]|uniref:Uncharacterized protein n=1 Tax=Portunus trituberculatus TaxID=210409 RepID=A0A5B7IDP3_PORTR|nr:hypothetical protein [Portunus trituberculatus]